MTPMSTNQLRRLVTLAIARHRGWHGEKQIVRLQRRMWRHR